MLWYCRFTWYPGATSESVRQRVMRQHAAGTNHPERIRGWFNLAGGGAGFLLIEADSPRDLNVMLEPYMDLVSWDVHACYELDYRGVTEHFQEMVRSAGMASPTGFPEASDGEMVTAFDPLGWSEPPAAGSEVPAVRR